MSEDLPHELKTLFERARGEEDPSNEDRLAVGRALAARLGLSAAAGVGAALSTGRAAAQGSATSAAGMTASAMAGKTGVAGAAALWLVIGATVGTGVSLATVLPPASPAAAVVSAAPAATHRALAHEPRNLPPPLRPAPSSIGSRAALAEPDAKVAPSSPSQPKMPETAAPEKEPRRVSASALQQETRELAAVQQALRDEQPEKALGLLEAQEQSFPDGELRAERAAARVLALCAGRRFVAARAAAAEFLKNHPDSPIANRVRGSCAR